MLQCDTISMRKSHSPKRAPSPKSLWQQGNKLHSAEDADATFGLSSGLGIFQFSVALSGFRV